MQDGNQVWLKHGEWLTILLVQNKSVTIQNMQFIEFLVGVNVNFKFTLEQTGYEGPEGE